MDAAHFFNAPKMPVHQRLLWLAALLATLALLAPGAHATAIGDRIAWSDVTLIDGRVLRAADLRNQTVVVQFWATWCPFCAAQNPHIQKLHERYLDKGLVVLTFSIDQDTARVRRYMADRGFTFAVAMAGAQSESWFGRRRALPEVYVVDPTGRIVFREFGEMFADDVAALARFIVRQ